ncbi:putative ABC transport system permease protein [Chryseolinea serpens]|uniref:Putative ABC transport system permease protein n=1 Tax=Chryseolinea serpens TaxID=947013 RepID=A0A1M5KCA8_9BACT|nr:ABC transporter permease [Chryseolinea serpens]SHG50378.1 putative ABC transport system permease protein [Chryseolinea serpens]
MLRNYLKTAFRSLLKNKGFSIINILGLAIGIASFVLIALYVRHELSYDRFNQKADRIFRIVENLRTENEMLFQSTSSPPMGPALASQMPEVDKFVRMQDWSFLVRKGDVSVFEEGCLLSDSTVFDIFSFPLLEGNPKKALTEPYSIVLTTSTAKKYFGDEPPVGKTLNMNGEEYKVTGLVADVPENSHIRFNMLVSFRTWSDQVNQPINNMWFWNGFHTYLLLKEGEGQVEKLRAKMPDFITRNMEKGGMYYEDLPLQPLTSIYLETPRSWENGKRGSQNNIYTLSIIAGFILLIACFNYINLATARASRRLKEVGLRKVLGAQRRALVYQFLGESIIVSFLATAFGFVLAALVLPVFNTLVETPLVFSLFPGSLTTWGGFWVIAIVLGLLSGVYPALVISGFQPLQIFRGAPQSIFGHNGLRKMLVSVQFVISIVLLAGTLIVFEQLDLLRSRDLGFVKEATLLIRNNGDRSMVDRWETVKGELLKVPGVLSAAACSTVPGEPSNNLYATIEMEDGKLSPSNINTNFIDSDFLPAYGIEIIAGRNFIKGSRADDTTAFIINETAVKDFGWKPEQALGKKVDQNGKQGTIIGVVKDYHYQSLHHKVAPLIMQENKWAYSTLSLKIKSDNMQATIKSIGIKWKDLTNNLPYRYSFLDDDYDRLYKADAQLGQVAGIFAGLAIAVGCLGLLGLTSFSVERRVKEIGIRKVLGATLGNIILIISKEFVGLILLSFVVAIPITWYLITRWLDNFTDKVTIGPVNFLVAGLSVLTLAWLTISYLSFKAANSNPTKALRNE